MVLRVARVLDRQALFSAAAGVDAASEGVAALSLS